MLHPVHRKQLRWYVLPIAFTYNVNISMKSSLNGKNRGRGWSYLFSKIYRFLAFRTNGCTTSPLSPSTHWRHRRSHPPAKSSSVSHTSARRYKRYRDCAFVGYWRRWPRMTPNDGTSITTCAMITVLRVRATRSSRRRSGRKLGRARGSYYSCPERDCTRKTASASAGM